MKYLITVENSEKVTISMLRGRNEVFQEMARYGWENIRAAVTEPVDVNQKELLGRICQRRTGLQGKEVLQYYFPVSFQDPSEEKFPYVVFAHVKYVLHAAIRKQKPLHLIRDLLKYGAHVDALDSNGNTPLHCCLIQEDYPERLDIIKLLLEHEADINVRNGKNRSALDIAIKYQCGSLVIAKLLIKYAMLREKAPFNSDILIHCYRKYKDYRKLKEFLEECAVEIQNMKIDKVDDIMYLYQIAISKNNDKPANLKNFMEKYAKEEPFLNTYSIYHDIISEKLNLTKVRLLKKMEDIQVCTITHGSEEKVFLNYDCLCHIAQYLPDEDLHNFLTAFCDPIDLVWKVLPVENGTSKPMKCVKRVRLD